MNEPAAPPKRLVGRPASVPGGKRRPVVLTDEAWRRLRVNAESLKQTASLTLEALIRSTLPE